MTQRTTVGERTDPTLSHHQVRQTPAIHSSLDPETTCQSRQSEFCGVKKRRRKSGVM